MAATILAAPTSRIRRTFAAAGLVRRTVAEIAAGAQVLLGAAVVLIAADRPSWITSTHRGAFAAGHRPPPQPVRAPAARPARRRLLGL